MIETLCDCEEECCFDEDGTWHRVGDHYGPCDACKGRPESMERAEAPEGEPC